MKSYSDDEVQVFNIIRVSSKGKNAAILCKEIVDFFFFPSPFSSDKQRFSRS